MAYEVGNRLIHTESGICGTVVENFKLPGDICVRWDDGLETSYDEEVLDEIVTKEKSTPTEEIKQTSPPVDL
jgi:hypothetical protein